MASFRLCLFQAGSMTLLFWNVSIPQSHYIASLDCIQSTVALRTASPLSLPPLPLSLPLSQPPSLSPLPHRPPPPFSPVPVPAPLPSPLHPSRSIAWLRVGSGPIYPWFGPSSFHSRFDNLALLEMSLFHSPIAWILWAVFITQAETYSSRLLPAESIQ